MSMRVTWRPNWLFSSCKEKLLSRGKRPKVYMCWKKTLFPLRNSRNSFKSRYLSDSYYDNHAKEFHELRLGHFTMDEFLEKITNLLQYIPYINEEKDNLRRFFFFLWSPYKKRIEFYNPKSMYEVVRKAKLSYQQFRNRSEGLKLWQSMDKRKTATSTKRHKPVYLKDFGKKH